MHNEDLAQVHRMPFVSLFQNLINSLLGNALDIGSSCSFGFALTRLSDCRSFACYKSLCSKFLFYFVLRSTILWHCSVPWVITPASLPCCIIIGARSLWLVPPPLAWAVFVPVNIVYLKASMPCWTYSLGLKIFASRMSASDTQLVEPLSLIKALPSPLYDLSKVSRLILVSLLDLSWFIPVCLSVCLPRTTACLFYIGSKSDAQISSRSFEALRSRYTFTTFTTPLRPLQPTDIILWCLVCDGGGLHFSGWSGINGASNDSALRLLLHDTSCLFPRKFFSCFRGSCLENADLLELYDSRRCQ